MISKGNRVRLQCSASISQFYWKSAEITLLQEKPKFASVMTSGDDSVSPEKPEDGKYFYNLVICHEYLVMYIVKLNEYRVHTSNSRTKK